MGELNLLLEAGLYQDALHCLNKSGSDISPEEYLFYQGFIQIHLSWSEEAIQTLTKLQMKYPDSLALGTVSGFLADIYQHDGQLGDALQEISKALELEPECPLIQKKANEIVNDFNDYLTGITIFALIAQSRHFKKV